MPGPMMAVPLCPCCGQKVNEFAELHWNEEGRTLSGRGRAVILSPLRARMFGVLWKRAKSGKLTSKAEMMSILYADDIDGGPLSDNIVSVQVVHLKNQIRPFGLSVRGRSGYVLVTASAEASAA